MQRQDVRQQPWMNYVDLEYRCGDPKATKLGAQVALPKMPVPGVWAVAASWIPRGTGEAVGRPNTNPRRPRINVFFGLTRLPKCGNSF
jgi:hypothetical protein